ncbi:HNH endonuclease family protein [Streptomyces griseiscabiei]|uniref:HNH endonuclease family protein n=1 Tax=Streptomyces griseiscabiei TaxID=2993540 RepID=A0ABU4KXU2_9ACTN|nr:HNH endonuclease family protein [Streptomyces griseiscabiei]MBZ3904427.1 HNH endonuclease [Streptomyces griseiscabiei]MDX2908174.1 HNH endonuclease family protein [Streptomyces griseiscabiei]
MKTLRIALAGILTVSALALAAPASPAVAAPGETVTASLSDLITALPVHGEGPRDGYSREQFRHWIDADRDGCHTRNEVLLHEAIVAPEVTGRCSITAGTGQWWSWYDETTQTDKEQVDIDHMVPLGEAWDSGAAAWSATERRDYANDLDDERSLLAVRDSVNQSKADRDPGEWMPPAASATCRYIADWVTVKTRWGLTADPAEHAAITRIAGGCDDPLITVTHAR